MVANQCIPGGDHSWHSLTNTTCLPSPLNATKDIINEEREPFPPTAHGLLQLPNYTCGLPSGIPELVFTTMPKPN